MLLLQMLSFMRAQYTLFQQGFNILDEIDPFMKKLAAQVRWNKPKTTENHACSDKKIQYMCTHTHTYSHKLVLLHWDNQTIVLFVLYCL